MTGNPLELLAQRGQSVWLDFIDRELVTTGRLAELISNDNVTGLTSNPTIFQKAIAEGGRYDEQLAQLVGAGMVSADDLFVELAVSDIQHAADILRPVYDRSGGGDGFVSLEVAPRLAHDTDATVEAAKYLWGRVERPNLMVKVPATPEGVPAVERLIDAGLNINVTLIFALTAYEAVAEAYIAGLEKRHGRGEPVTNRSVASFFVSRVDTAVDKLIEAKLAEGGQNEEELRSLRGKAAIANAVLAYERFEQVFGKKRFDQLRRAGATVQRPLWASTSAKNPAYRDVVYAEALIGPDTVDTMPPSTIDAFADHGRVVGDTVRAGYEDAHRTMERLAAVGIDMDRVAQDLLAAGVTSFADSYDELIHAIAVKADGLRGGLAARTHLDLGTLTSTARSAIDAAGDVAWRVWERDPSLWKPNDPAHAGVIANRLGWLDVVETMRGEADRLLSFAERLRSDGIRDAVLLGMGGSSLCPEVLRSSFGSAAGYPTLHVLDTTDPAAIEATTAAIDPRTTLFIAASKSGGTVETLSHVAHFTEVLRGAGVADPGRHFVAITDPGTPLATGARERGYREVFENPPDIGGRYSALSFFGLVPAAVMGIDVRILLARAAAMRRQCAAGQEPALNVGLALGTVMGLMHGGGRDKVTILAPPRIAAFSLWAEQLIAESTGKEGKGIIPIGSEPIGEPSVYGDDRLFVALRLGGDEAFDASIGALRTAGQPVVTLELDDLYDLAGEFFRWEFATAVAGSHLQIDPFDEPNVTESKENTKRLLEIAEREGSLPDPGEPTVEGEGMAVWGGARASGPAAAVGAHLAAARPGDYVALMAYVTPDGVDEASLQGLRVAIRDRHRLATTLGFGPRFLHSTGQLHKGGPNTGVFVQITVDDATDVSIPGEPYTFSVLKRAQAQGDLQSLHDHGRRVIRVHVRGDLGACLGELTDAVRDAAATRH